MEEKVYSQYYNNVRDDILTKDLYYQSVRSKILKAALKHQSDNVPKGGAVVTLCGRSDGLLQGEPAIVGKSDPELADIAIKSVVESLPFDPFPKSIPEPALSFKIPISFE